MMYTDNVERSICVKSGDRDSQNAMRNTEEVKEDEQTTINDY